MERQETLGFSKNVKSSTGIGRFLKNVTGLPLGEISRYSDGRSGATVEIKGKGHYKVSGPSEEAVSAFLANFDYHSGSRQYRAENRVSQV